MRFEDWKILKESSEIDYQQVSKIGSELKQEIEKKYHKLFMVPDFEMFSREKEPVQHSVLYTDKDLNTFSVNLVSPGEIYSIDFWKKDKSQPVVTVYPENKGIDALGKLIPAIIEDPKKTVSTVKATISKKRLVEDTAEDGSRIEEPHEKKEADPELNKINKKLEEEPYDFSDPETIFEDLRKYVQMVIKGAQPSLLITGAPGVGKTHEVIGEMKKAGLKKDEDYIQVKGRSTAAGMFITLYENNGKIIIFDDCDSVFKSEDAVNILKGALDSYDVREISWLVGRPLKSASGESIPKTFDFTGKVIFISNLPQRKIDDAVKTRSFIIEVALRPSDMLDKMRRELPNIMKDVPLRLREEAMDLIEEVSEKAENLELNMRTLIKTIKILREIDDMEVAERLILQQCSYK